MIHAPNSKELDISDLESLKNFIEDYDIDIIIHTAHFNKRRRDLNPDIEVEFDLRMFSNLLKVSTQVEKIIHFGSGAEFDKSFDISNIQESEFGRSIPTFPYGLSKYLTNILTYSKPNIYNLRLFGLFGKYEDWRMYFISNACCKALFDLPITIRQDCYFDYMHINDLYRIIEWFIDATPKYQDYNICTGSRILLSDIAEIIRTVSKKEHLEINILNEGLNKEYTGSNERLLNEMGEIRFEDLNESISKLYKWYSSNSVQIDFQILKESK